MRYEYRYIDIHWDPWTECQSPQEFLLSIGNNIIGIQSIDSAGNVSQVTSRSINRENIAHEEILDGTINIVEYLGTSFTKEEKA